jgi:hypothetical protein
MHTAAQLQHVSAMLAHQTHHVLAPAAMHVTPQYQELIITSPLPRCCCCAHRPEFAYNGEHDLNQGVGFCSSRIACPRSCCHAAALLRPD